MRFLTKSKMLDKIVSKPQPKPNQPIAAKPLSVNQLPVQVLPVSGSSIANPVLISESQANPVYVISSNSGVQHDHVTYTGQESVQIPVPVSMQNTEPGPVATIEYLPKLPKQSVPTSTPIGSNKRKAIAPKVSITVT